MSVLPSPSAPDGFLAFSHAGDDFRVCRDHVRERLGILREAGQRRPPEACPPTPKIRGEHDEQRVHSLAQGAAYVREMRPVRGSRGERYLSETRRIEVEAIGDVLERIDALGWHPAVYFHEPGHPLHGQRLGCIIAVMTDPVTARPTGAISRTYIDGDLQKIGKAKTLGSPAGVVRLSLDEEVLEGLHLAEGLETALSAMANGLRPIWSTGSTALMKAFPVLGGIECLTVIADHDPTEAGEKAAREVEARWRLAKRETRIFMPASPGDLNDLLRRAKG
jgi:putative DNA primase/helicase